MGTIEAVRKATDPYGLDGTATSAARPSASEVVERLRLLGFKVIRTQPVCRHCGKRMDDNNEHFPHIGIVHPFETYV